MEHLSIEEIIKYVTANKTDAETLDLLSRVNGHIRVCSQCKEKLLAYEYVNDTLKLSADEKDLDLECEQILSK